ncbi:hypothetical protein HanXRQr2_Chr13g0599611 [Helianthus annuus]|uniref:Uncharacterized protein n=1 Tax=Helianthus annuus TaxID=4232 RepID=A0A9K3EJX8_HELAN|nr:hypothetical protein HanXRQr2_Chr13g0599611 [Helianthus annuus]
MGKQLQMHSLTQDVIICKHFHFNSLVYFDFNSFRNLISLAFRVNQLNSFT